MSKSEDRCASSYCTFIKNCEEVDVHLRALGISSNLMDCIPGDPEVNLNSMIPADMVRRMLKAAILKIDWRWEGTHPGHIAAWRVQVAEGARQVTKSTNLYYVRHLSSCGVKKMQRWGEGRIGEWPDEGCALVPHGPVYDLTPVEFRL